MARRLQRPAAILVIYSLALLLLLLFKPHSPGLIFTLLSLPLATASLLLEVGFAGGIGLGSLTALLGLPFLSLTHLGWLLPIALFFGASSAALGLARRAQSQQRTRRGEASLEELFQRSGNIVLIVELGGRVLRSNDRAKGLIGKGAELSEIFHPDDLQRVREEMERAVVRGEGGEAQVRLISREKEVLPLSLKVVRLDREHVALELHEVGELVELRRRLHEAEARYRYLIEDAIDTLNSGIILLDRNGRVFWANETVGRFFYIDRDELVGKELRKALAPCQPFFIEPGSFDHVTSPHGEGRFTFTLRGRGEERILELVSIPVETEKYQGGWINHFIDLTEIKRLEASLWEKFNHVVSHDLKGPVRRIESFAQILLEDYQERLDAEGVDHLTRIKNQALRMSNLIDDLLTLASIGAKEEPLEEVQLGEVVSETVEGLDYMLQGVEFKVKDALPTVLANRTRMQQLLANLITNAVKYNNKPRKLVEIGWEEEDGYWKLHVRDNGIGIEKQYWSKVFELFEVLHPNGDYESTGAGLSICKRIVENHGGKIWVESEPERGSTFYFTIPMRAKVGEPR